MYHPIFVKSKLRTPKGLKALRWAAAGARDRTMNHVLRSQPPCPLYHISIMGSFSSPTQTNTLPNLQGAEYYSESTLAF